MPRLGGALPDFSKGTGMPCVLAWQGGASDSRERPHRRPSPADPRQNLSKLSAGTLVQEHHPKLTGVQASPFRLVHAGPSRARMFGRNLRNALGSPPSIIEIN